MYVSYGSTTGNLKKSSTSDRTKLWPQIPGYRFIGCPSGYQAALAYISKEKKKKKQFKERNIKKSLRS